ncbi:MAG TPA: hypothetical protein PKD45_01915 [Flavobacteriales bacterium]|nr:hypothetical protein [Flavobacteriales bacterium]
MAQPRILRTWRFPALALLAVLAATGWWVARHGEAWLQRTVEVRIHEAIDRASVPGYSFTMRDLRTDALNGSLMVTGAELRFDPRLLDSLHTGAYHYLFSAEADTIALRGLSLWRLLLKGVFKVDALVVAGPQLRYFTGPGRIDPADPFNRLAGTGGGHLIRFLSADTLRVNRAEALVQNLAWRLPALQVGGLALECTGASMHAPGTRSGVRISVDQTSIHLDSISTLLPDGSHLRTGAIALERAGGKGLLTGLRITPPPLDTADTEALRSTRVALTVDSIQLFGLDLDRSISDQALLVQRAQVFNLKTVAALDKTRPDPPARFVQLPAMALDSLAFPVRLDTLDLLDAQVLYKEREPRTGRWGTVPFHGIQARFTGISNEEDPRARNRQIMGDLRFHLFGQAECQARYVANRDRRGRFTLDATLMDLPLTRIDTLTRSLLRMQVLSGELHRLRLHMEGNDNRARGTLAMHYSDLRFRVEPGTPAEERHQLFGSVLEAMLSESYGGGLSDDRERTFAVERAKDRSIFTYAWHATREGLLRNLMPEAKDRMRQMLRTDVDNLREQRALNKAKKNSSH